MVLCCLLAASSTARADHAARADGDRWLLRAPAGPVHAARAMRTSGIVLTAVGGAAALAALVVANDGFFTDATTDARHHAAVGLAISSATSIAIGIPLLCVGHFRLRDLRLAVTADGREAGARLTFRF
jgi:hypothetical protein